MAALIEPATDELSVETRMNTIERKLDFLTANLQLLTEQMTFLTTQAVENRRRQQEWDDLSADLKPVVKDMYAITVQQLEEIQAYVQLEDVMRLMKRLARNTRTFEQLLDQMESLSDLVRDVSPLTKDMFNQMVEMLNELELKGYFGFMRQGLYVLDQIVTSFDEDDVRQLGDNVVLILNTVKALTQPELMNLANNLTQGFYEVEAHPEVLSSSTSGLFKQMRDPDVRRGLAITMALLKRISQQYALPTHANGNAN